MDSNTSGEFKRPKRPRIGSNTDSGYNADSRFEKVSYGKTNPDGEPRNYHRNDDRPQRH